MWPGNWFQALFNFQIVLCKNDSRGKHADLDRFPKLYLLLRIQYK